jgi:hypothetical protein
MIVWMTKGKLTPGEIMALSNEVTMETTSIVDLTKRLQDLQKRFA